MPYPVNTFNAPLNSSTISTTAAAFDTGPRENHIGYIIGQHVLRPLINLIAHIVNGFFRAFSFPGAAAQTVPCNMPTGSYLKTCTTPNVELSPDSSCLLTTQCTIPNSVLGPVANAYQYLPGATPMLENHNGILRIQRGFTPPQESDTLKSLASGSVISLDTKGSLLISSNLPSDLSSFSTFQSLAKKTGGLVGTAPKHQNLPAVMSKMFEHILRTTAPDQSIDLAFVIDSTGSMSDDIGEVKRHLTQFLEHLGTTRKGGQVRIALMEFRDIGEDFITRLNLDFTQELTLVSKALQEITVSGGGDTNEAALDALYVAQTKLSWGEKTKRCVLLITDAPSKEMTLDTHYKTCNEESIAKQYTAANTQIVFYPIIT